MPAAIGAYLSILSSERAGTGRPSAASSPRVGTSQVAPTRMANLSGSVLAGMAVTSHDTGAFCTVTYTSVTIG